MKARDGMDIGSSVFDAMAETGTVTNTKVLPKFVNKAIKKITDNTGIITVGKALVSFCCWRRKYILTYATGGSSCSINIKEVKVCPVCGKTTTNEWVDMSGVPF